MSTLLACLLITGGCWTIAAAARDRVVAAMVVVAVIAGAVVTR